MTPVRLVDLGGAGHVTQNMYLYQYENEIMIVECGIGFPDDRMPGVDILIPDIRYLLQRLNEGAKIVGMILTHGHDDHIAATPYLLPELPDFPIYASPLTAGFTENRMKESAAKGRKITVLKDLQPVKVGSYFEFYSLAMTHSVPDTKHFVISSPVGIFYHGTDFKLDKNPVDGIGPDYDTIKKVGAAGVDFVLMDCLRVERDSWVPSESTTGPAIARQMESIKGKCVVTLMSSHLHRIQQTVDAAVQQGRKIAFIGRSVEQNVEVALRLNMLNIPHDIKIDKRDLDRFRDDQLCLIVAGSQGQEGSSLVRAVFGEHPIIQIKPNDKVLFLADAIPGNEIPYYKAIDELSRNGVDVVYPEIDHNLHQSGHGSAEEQRELLGMLKPKYVMPIGGSDRHRVKFVDFVAKKVGMREDQVLIPGAGDILDFSEDKTVRVSEVVKVEPQAVDGLGIGDVGPRVLSDRRILSEAGMIVIVLPRKNGEYQLRRVEVVSRGFVFMKQADEVVEFIKKTVATIISNNKGKKDAVIRATIEKKLSRELFKTIRREPLIMAVSLEI